MPVILSLSVVLDTVMSKPFALLGDIFLSSLPNKSERGFRHELADSYLRYASLQIAEK